MQLCQFTSAEDLALKAYLKHVHTNKFPHPEVANMLVCDEIGTIY